MNELEAEKVKLNSEAFRLELELSKVLRENEELFKTRLGAGAGVKTGASAHLVHSLKRRIKELEATVEKKEGELKKVKSDTRVTRLAEMEVEKDAYLYEVRRLQKELARIAAVTGGVLGPGFGDGGDGTQRDADDLRRKVHPLAASCGRRLAAPLSQRPRLETLSTYRLRVSRWGRCSRRRRPGPASAAGWRPRTTSSASRSLRVPMPLPRPAVSALEDASAVQLLGVSVLAQLVSSLNPGRTAARGTANCPGRAPPLLKPCTAL